MRIQKILFLAGFFVTSGAWALNAPTNLKASAVSSSQINLAWADQASLESGFIVERSLSSTAGFKEIARVGANTTKYVSASLSPATSYYYRVRAYRLKSATTVYSPYTFAAGAKTLAGVSPAPLPSPAPAPLPTPVPTPIASSGRIFGVTITNPWNQMAAIVKSLSSFAVRPTSRVVFDEFVPAKDYKTVVDQIHPVSGVMGEILDSYYVPQYSVQAYKDRTSEYVNTLGSSVDIWEIGNEINGEWLGDTASVSAKMAGSYDIVKAAGKKAALTLYFNQNCWEKADHEMFTWAQANVPDRMKTGLDYVLISFYEDDCNGIQPDWNQVFQKLGALFPNSKIGFGENGTITASRKEAYINRYYRMTINHPRFIGGNFWWYFDANQKGGAGDMVPSTNYLWNVLNDAVKSTPGY